MLQMSATESSHVSSLRPSALSLCAPLTRMGTWSHCIFFYWGVTGHKTTNACINSINYQEVFSYSELHLNYSFAHWKSGRVLQMSSFLQLKQCEGLTHGHRLVFVYHIMSAIICGKNLLINSIKMWFWINDESRKSTHLPPQTKNISLPTMPWIKTY